MDNTEVTKFKDTKKILPFVDNLVDALHTPEINELIAEHCVTIDDKRVFLMFIITYFYSFMSVREGESGQKTNMKRFLTDIITDPAKRLKCLELYTLFEDENKKILYN
jgi:hypothetical protein